MIPINLPALRERVEDIPLLVDHFLRRFLPDAYKGSLGSMIDDDACAACRATSGRATCASSRT